MMRDPMGGPSKSELREVARARRRGLVFAGFADALAGHAGALGLAPGTIVGGYRALAEEADPALLLARLAEDGCSIAFPRVVGQGAPLVFHLAGGGGAMAPGAFGIHEPPGHWPAIDPAVVLVPLLAFDGEFHRLGYGGGYYDRTLARLTRARAIGIAFAGQRMDFLPHGAHDWPLDAILTEQGLLSR